MGSIPCFKCCCCPALCPQRREARKHRSSDGPCSPPFPLPDPGAPPNVSHPTILSGSTASRLPRLDPVNPATRWALQRFSSARTFPNQAQCPRLGVHGHPQTLSHFGKFVSRQMETFGIIPHSQAYGSPRQAPLLPLLYTHRHSMKHCSLPGIFTNA